MGSSVYNWQTYTVNFTGDGSTQRLEFLSTGTPLNYGRGGHLDNIELLAYDANPNLGGSDTLQGGAGNDILNGANYGSSTPGANQADFLNGGAGNDTFVLGDKDAVYYSYGVTTGLLDVAIIEDFNPSEDVIQLKGNANSYRLRSFGSGTVLGTDTQVGAGVGIMSSSREIIGFVQDVNINELNLNSTSFEYV